MSSSSTFLARRFSSEKSLAFFIQLSYIFFGRVDHKSSTIWTSFLTIPKILASTTLFNAPTDHLGMAKDGKSQLWVNASTSSYNHPCFGWFRVENATIFPKWCCDYLENLCRDDNGHTRILMFDWDICPLTTPPLFERFPILVGNTLYSRIWIIL